MPASNEWNSMLSTKYKGLKFQWFFQINEKSNNIVPLLTFYL